MYIIPRTQNLVNNFRESGHHKKASIPNTEVTPSVPQHLIQTFIWVNWRDYDHLFLLYRSFDKTWSFHKYVFWSYRFVVVILLGFFVCLFLGLGSVVVWMRNGPHRLGYLNTWFQVDSSVWGGLGGMDLWRKYITGSGLCDYAAQL